MRDIDPELMAKVYVAILMAFIVLAVFGCHQFAKSRGVEYDFVTGTRTWKDAQGRTLIESRDGSVRELSNR